MRTIGTAKPHCRACRAHHGTRCEADHRSDNGAGAHRCARCKAHRGANDRARCRG